MGKGHALRLEVWGEKKKNLSDEKKKGLVKKRPAPTRGDRACLPGQSKPKKKGKKRKQPPKRSFKREEGITEKKTGGPGQWKVPKRGKGRSEGTASTS